MRLAWRASGLFTPDVSTPPEFEDKCARCRYKSCRVTKNDYFRSRGGIRLAKEHAPGNTGYQFEPVIWKKSHSCMVGTAGSQGASSRQRFYLSGSSASLFLSNTRTARR